MRTITVLSAWLALLLGCTAAPHAVRYRTASGAMWTYHPTSPVRPVVISERELQQAIRLLAQDHPEWAQPLEDARRFFEIPVRSGWYLYEVRTHRVIPEADDSPMDEVSMQHWVASYTGWCARTRYGPGDCLHLLVKGRLTSHGRYVWALAMARGEVLDATLESLKQSGQPKAVLGMLACAAGMYLMLWTLPEPVSKGVAAVITAALICYLGVDTMVQLCAAFEQMVKESDQARDFGELRAAGEKFGKVFGENAARVLVSLVAAAIGRTNGLAAKLPSLPGAPQAFRLALEQSGFDLAAIGSVETVVVSSGTVSISLASGSVAMASVGKGGGGGGLSNWTPPKEGPGEWAQANESMLEFSAEYQSQVAGAPRGWVYRLNGVDFDGYQDGVLLDAKGRYAQFLEKGQPKPFFTGFDEFPQRAMNQLRAARGLRVRWVFAEEEAANYVRGLFQRLAGEQYSRLAEIEIVHVPARQP